MRALPLACAALLAGCSPALNWRQMDLSEADGLRLRFPCKPERAERNLRLPGLAEPLRMTMWSCEAAGATWVLSATRLSNVADVSPALRAWSSATQGNLAWADQRARQQIQDAGLPDAPTLPAWRQPGDAAVQVPGMTPNPAAQGWRTQGFKPDGAAGAQPLAVDAWHFSHGLRVFQASVWRAESAMPLENGEDATQVFLRALHFPG